jgi:hypothetical protein
MRIEELETLEKPTYSHRLSVYLDDVKSDDKDEIAGMLRGLMCAIEGWGPLAGLTNDHFQNNSPVILTFSSAKNAAHFKNCVDYYFDDEHLEALKVRRRIVKL